MPRRRAVRGSEHGYAVAMTALLLVPLLAFVGLAVDLGSWYARAAVIQRATDAASLAGVTALPQGFGDAVARAQGVAAANGFVDGVDGVSVSVEQVGSDRVRVTITEDGVPQYLTSLFRSSVSVTRSSIAEYVPPVRMGSPRNFLGTQRLPYSVSGLPPGAIMEEFFLSVNSPCSLTEDGDKVATLWAASWGQSNYCNPGGSAIPNPTYSAAGYLYGVRVEDGYSAGPVTVEVFDAAMCAAPNPPDTGWHDAPRLGNSSFSTRFTVRDPAPNPLQGTLRAVVDVAGRAGLHSNDGPCNATTGWRNRWRSLDAIADPVPGEIYTIQVQSHSPTNNNRGNLNNFALRARTGASFVACSADPFETDPALTAAATGVAPEDCPNVFALEDLSIFANSQASVAEFFIASVGPEHSGKTLVLDLFDPGEGGQELWILDPNGFPVEFQRRVIPRYPSEQVPAGGWGPVSQLSVDISGTGAQPGPGRLSQFRYNDRQLRLEIQLPPDITEAYGGRTWWRVRYQFSATSSVTDRTTWSVTVRGDPVRLIQ